MQVTRRELRGQVGWKFTICVTTTLWQCSDSTVTQNEKFDPVDCTNSTVRAPLRRCWSRGNCGAESGHGVAETDCLWNDSTSLKINNSLFTHSSECSLASVPPACGSHDCNGLVLQEEGTATFAECYEVKSSATALTTQICNFDGYTATGLLFSSCVTTTLLRCSDSTIAQNEKFDALGWAPDGTNWTSDDQCKVMYAADFTSSAGTVTGTLDVVNGSMAVGSLPNGLAALGVMDGIPGGTGTGLFFWSLVMPIVQTSTRPWASYLPHCLGYLSAFLSATLIRFILVAKTCLARAVRSLTTAPGRAWKAPL